MHNALLPTLNQIHFFELLPGIAVRVSIVSSTFESSSSIPDGLYKSSESTSDGKDSSDSESTNIS